jgi:hypothetical protein
MQDVLVYFFSVLVKNLPECGFIGIPQLDHQVFVKLHGIFEIY